MKPKLVLDTNVLVSAVHFGGRPEELLMLANEGAVRLFLSPFILEETSLVLKKKLGWTSSRARDFIEAIAEVATVIEPETHLEVVEDDETDNRILECAVDAKADFLVTGDRRHLLPLKRYRKIRIVTPAKCMELLFK